VEFLDKKDQEAFFVRGLEIDTMLTLNGLPLPSNNPKTKYFY
jgi:hypothetical protein